MIIIKTKPKTKQQLLPEIENLQARLEAREQRFQGPRETLQALAQKYAESIVETVREPLVVLASSLKVISANRSFYETFQVTPRETEGRSIFDIGNHQWDIPSLRVLLEKIIPKNTIRLDTGLQTLDTRLFYTGI